MEKTKKAMSWFKRSKKSIEQPTPPDERRVKTEGLWTKCTGCRAIVWKKDLEANAHVCAKCQHHFRLNARQRLELLLDGRWIEHDAQLASNDPLHFADTRPYADRLKEARRKLGMNDAVLTAEGLLAAHSNGILHCDFKPNNVILAGSGKHERAVMSRLRHDEAMQLDALIEGLEGELASPEIFAALFELELAGRV